MRIIKEFEKLKLTPNIKTQYTLESEKRKNNAVGSIDDKIAKLYKIVTTGEYTHAWCDAVEALVKEVSSLNKTIVDRSTKMKEYSQMSSTYKYIRESIDFTKTIDDIVNKYETLAQSYINMYNDSSMDAYKKLHNSSADVAKLNRFTQEVWVLKSKAPSSSVMNVTSKEVVLKYNRIVELASKIDTLLAGRTKAYDDINLETSINNFYAKYMEIVTKCDVEYKKSQKEFFAFIDANYSYGYQLEEFCKNAPKQLPIDKELPKNISSDAKQKFSQIKNKYIQFSKELPNKANAVLGLFIEKEINNNFKNAFNEAKEIHIEFDKNPNLFFKKKSRATILIDGKTVKALNSSLSEIKKKMNEQNKKYIGNLAIFNNLITELKVIQEIEKLDAYYKFIQKYPYQNGNPDDLSEFNKLDKAINFKAIKFPFQSEWSKTKDLFAEYTRRIAKEREEQLKKEKAAKRRKAILTFPFRMIFNLFKYLFLGIFFVFKWLVKFIWNIIIKGTAKVLFTIVTFPFKEKNLGVSAIFSSLISITCIVLTFLGIFKFVHIEKAQLIIIAIVQIVISILCIVGGFINDDDLDNFGQYIVLSIYPLLPLMPLFLGKALNLDIVMLIVLGIGLIVTSVIFCFELDYLGPAFFIFVIGNIALMFLGIIACKIMREHSSNKVMYIFFYIYFFATEVYMIFEVGAQNEMYCDEIRGIVIFLIGALLVVASFVMYSFNLWYGAFVTIAGLIISFCAFMIECEEIA